MSDNVPMPLVGPWLTTQAELYFVENGLGLLAGRRYNRMLQDARTGTGKVKLNKREQALYTEVKMISIEGRQQLVAKKGYGRGKTRAISQEAWLMTGGNLWINFLALHNKYIHENGEDVFQRQAFHRAKESYVAFFVCNTHNLNVANFLNNAGVWPPLSQGPNLRMIECLPDFLKDPEAFMAKVRAQQQQKTMPQLQQQPSITIEKGAFQFATGANSEVYLPGAFAEGFKGQVFMKGAFTKDSTTNIFAEGSFAKGSNPYLNPTIHHGSKGIKSAGKSNCIDIASDSESDLESSTNSRTGIGLSARKSAARKSTHIDSDSDDNIEESSENSRTNKGFEEDTGTGAGVFSDDGDGFSDSESSKVPTNDNAEAGDKFSKDSTDNAKTGDNDEFSEDFDDESSKVSTVDNANSGKGSDLHGDEFSEEEFENDDDEDGKSTRGLDGAYEEILKEVGDKMPMRDTMNLFEKYGRSDDISEDKILEERKEEVPIFGKMNLLKEYGRSSAKAKPLSDKTNKTVIKPTKQPAKGTTAAESILKPTKQSSEVTIGAESILKSTKESTGKLQGTGAKSILKATKKSTSKSQGAEKKFIAIVKPTKQQPTQSQLQGTSAESIVVKPTKPAGILRLQRNTQTLPRRTCSFGNSSSQLVYKPGFPAAESIIGEPSACLTKTPPKEPQQEHKLAIRVTTAGWKLEDDLNDVVTQASMETHDVEVVHLTPDEPIVDNRFNCIPAIRVVALTEKHILVANAIGQGFYAPIQGVQVGQANQISLDEAIVSIEANESDAFALTSKNNLYQLIDWQQEIKPVPFREQVQGVKVMHKYVLMIKTLAVAAEFKQATTVTKPTFQEHTRLVIYCLNTLKEKHTIDLEPGSIIEHLTCGCDIFLMVEIIRGERYFKVGNPDNGTVQTLGHHLVNPDDSPWDSPWGVAQGGLYGIFWNGSTIRGLGELVQGGLRNPGVVWPEHQFSSVWGGPTMAIASKGPNQLFKLVDWGSGPIQVDLKDLFEPSRYEVVDVGFNSRHTVALVKGNSAVVPSALPSLRESQKEVADFFRGK